MNKLTRKDYMKDSSNLHHEYYSQFVTESTLNFIRTQIGIDKLKSSKCEHLNDLYSHSRGGAWGWIWDHSPINLELARELGEVWPNGLGSQSTHTCIGKAAARMLLEGEA